jgi:hypothetical protein
MIKLKDLQFYQVGEVALVKNVVDEKGNIPCAYTHGKNWKKALLEIINNCPSARFLETAQTEKYNNKINI